MPLPAPTPTPSRVDTGRGLAGISAAPASPSVVRRAGSVASNKSTTSARSVSRIPSSTPAPATPATSSTAVAGVSSRLYQSPSASAGYGRARSQSHNPYSSSTTAIPTPTTTTTTPAAAAPNTATTPKPVTARSISGRSVASATSQRTNTRPGTTPTTAPPKPAPVVAPAKPVAPVSRTTATTKKPTVSAAPAETQPMWPGRKAPTKKVEAVTVESLKASAEALNKPASLSAALKGKTPAPGGATAGSASTSRLAAPSTPTSMRRVSTGLLGHGSAAASTASPAAASPSSRLTARPPAAPSTPTSSRLRSRTHDPSAAAAQAAPAPAPAPAAAPPAIEKQESSSNLSPLSSERVLKKILDLESERTSLMMANANLLAEMEKLKAAVATVTVNNVEAAAPVPATASPASNSVPPTPTTAVAPASNTPPTKEFSLADETAPFDTTTTSFDMDGIMTDSELDAVYQRTIAKMRLMIDDGLGAVKREIPRQSAGSESSDRVNKLDLPMFKESKDDSSPTTAVEGPKVDLPEKSESQVKLEGVVEGSAEPAVIAKVEEELAKEPEPAKSEPVDNVAPTTADEEIKPSEEPKRAEEPKAELVEELQQDTYFPPKLSPLPTVMEEDIEEEISETTVSYADLPSLAQVAVEENIVGERAFVEAEQTVAVVETPVATVEAPVATVEEPVAAIEKPAVLSAAESVVSVAPLPGSFDTPVLKANEAPATLVAADSVVSVGPLPGAFVTADPSPKPEAEEVVLPTYVDEPATPPDASPAQSADSPIASLDSTDGSNPSSAAVSPALDSSISSDCKPSPEPAKLGQRGSSSGTSAEDSLGSTDRSSSIETLAMQPSMTDIRAPRGPTSDDGKGVRMINIVAELDRMSIRSAPVFRRVKFSPPSLADDLDGLQDEVSTIASDERSESSSALLSEAPSDSSYVSAINDVELNASEARKFAMRLMVLLRDLESAAESFSATAAAAPAQQSSSAPLNSSPLAAAKPPTAIGLGLLLQEHALNNAAGPVSAATPQAAVLRLAREASQVAEAFGKLCGLEGLSSSSSRKGKKSPNPVTRASLPPRAAATVSGRAHAPSLREMVGRQALMSGGPMGPAGMGLGMPYTGMGLRRPNSYAASVV